MSFHCYPIIPDRSSILRKAKNWKYTFNFHFMQAEFDSDKKEKMLKLKTKGKNRVLGIPLNVEEFSVDVK